MHCITISKDEDMARLQAMALLLLSKSFKYRDSEMLNAACEWTKKSNDVSLLIWANSQISCNIFIIKIFKIINDSFEI